MRDATDRRARLRLRVTDGVPARGRASTRDHFAAAPPKIAVMASRGRSSGRAAMAIAKGARPPIAKTSETHWRPRSTRTSADRRPAAGRSRACRRSAQLVGEAVDRRVVRRVEPGEEIGRLGRRAQARQAPPPGRPRRAWRRIRRSRSGRSAERVVQRAAELHGVARPTGRQAGIPAAAGPECEGPGGSPGLQRQWWRTRYGTVGSTPMHSRQTPRRVALGGRSAREGPRGACRDLYPLTTAPQRCLHPCPVRLASLLAVEGEGRGPGHPQPHPGSSASR